MPPWAPSWLAVLIVVLLVLVLLAATGHLHI